MTRLEQFAQVAKKLGFDAEEFKAEYAKEGHDVPFLRALETSNLSSILKTSFSFKASDKGYEYWQPIFNGSGRGKLITDLATEYKWL